MWKQSFFLKIFLILTLILNCCYSSTCNFIFVLSVLYNIIADFVSQNNSTNADGSEGNPYPDMTTAINQTINNDSDITLVLLYSTVPYNIFEQFYSNINLFIT